MKSIRITLLSLSVACGLNAQNLLTNGSFNDGATVNGYERPSGWTCNPNTDGTVVIDVNGFDENSVRTKALKLGIAGNTTNKSVSQIINITSGTTYLFQGYIQYPNTSATYAKVILRNSSTNAEIDSWELPKVGSTVNPVKLDNLVSHNFTIPANYPFTTIIFEINSMACERLSRAENLSFSPSTPTSTENLSTLNALQVQNNYLLTSNDVRPETIAITTSTGKSIRLSKDLSIAELPAGVYIISASTKNNEKVILKFIR